MIGKLFRAGRSADEELESIKQEADVERLAGAMERAVLRMDTVDTAMADACDSGTAQFVGSYRGESMYIVSRYYLEQHGICPQ